MIKYQSHVTKVKLTKSYAQIKNAIQLAPQNTNCTNGDYECTGIFNSATNAQAAVSSALKVNTTCTPNDTSNNCANIIPEKSSLNRIVLEDGTVFAFEIDSTKKLLNIYSDADGVKGKGEEGTDIFAFSVAGQTKNDVQIATVMPFGSKIKSKYTNNDDSEYWQNKKTCIYSYDLSCTARVLEGDTIKFIAKPADNPSSGEDNGNNGNNGGGNDSVPPLPGEVTRPY